MDGDRRIRDLGTLAGQTFRFESRFPGQDPRYAIASNHHVIEARTDIDLNVAPCEGGRTNIKANFRHPSQLEGDIGLFIGKSPVPVRRAASIDEDLVKRLVHVFKA